MSSLSIKIPPKLIPVFADKYRYRGAYGGRGSGKTRSFAKMAGAFGYRLAYEANKRGVIVCGREFQNSLSESSFAEVKEAILSEPQLAQYYDIGENFIRTKNKAISFEFIGLRRNLDSIKSKARVHLIWVDEAEPVSETAWLKIVPTVREHDSEIWVTWNPERKHSATHKRFRENPPTDSMIVELNWRDNPLFPDVLEQERLEDFAKRPQQYEHIWEGGFATAVEGAYFTNHINEAKATKRIATFPIDPIMPVKTFWDIGISDATSIWVAQWIGSEIYVVDYYEAENQPLAAHLNWLRSRGYENAKCYLPHDGEKRDVVTGIRFEDHIRSAGFEVETIRNQGKGAAMKRVEAARRLFPRIKFDKDKCEAGIEALGFYHEKRDTERNIGLGPEHDESSHAADAFGLMCVAYEAPNEHFDVPEPETEWVV